MHAGIGFILEEKMKSGELGNKTESEHKAIDSLKECVIDGVMWDDVTPNTNDAQLQVVRMVNVYRYSLAQTIEPVAVERRLEVTVGDGFILSGQSDLQTLEPGKIRDHKSGKLHRMHHGQIGSYSLLARTAHPELPIKELCVDFIPRVTMKKSQPLPITDDYDQRVAENAAHSTLQQIMQTTIDFRRRLAGDEPPEHAFLANPSSMLCSEKYCPAWGTSFCREHKGAK
jgi:hypothetical protein